MKKFPVFLSVVVLLALLTGCGRQQATSAEVDIEATVQAAIAATATGEAALQAAIGAAVQATAAAQTAVDAAVVVATPTPLVVTELVTQVVTETVYVPQEVYMTMSEDALAALIDGAVEQATAATVAYSSAATAATTDAVVTSAEVDTVELYVQLAEETVAYAEDLLMAYSDLYGANTAEVVNAIAGVEAELTALADNTATMATALDDINDTLDAGLTLAETTIAQVETTAAAATATVQDAMAQSAALVSMAQTEAAAYQATLQESRDAFATLVQNAQPQVVAASQAEAIREVFTYADGVRRALADNQISTAEMQQIAQLNANAVASLNSQGGRFSTLSPTLTDLTNTLARGDLATARQGLGQVEAQLPSRDALGALDVGSSTQRPAIGNSRPAGRRP